MKFILKVMWFNNFEEKSVEIPIEDNETFKSLKKKIRIATDEDDPENITLILITPKEMIYNFNFEKFFSKETVDGLD